MPEMDVSTYSHSLVYVGIGSNLDNPLGQVNQAVSRLDQLPECTVTAVSPWYGSTPVGGEPDQPDYVNGVVCLKTTRQPNDLLTALQAIEYAQGRKRETRWGARTLDLDILLYGNLVTTDPQLTIPHPRLSIRPFVLYPLADIAPKLVLPGGVTVASLLAGLDTAGIWRLPTTAHHPIQQQGTNDR